MPIGAAQMITGLNIQSVERHFQQRYLCCRVKIIFTSIYSFLTKVHFVHWNASKYHSPTEAVSEPDGLAVLGVFLEVIHTSKSLRELTLLYDQ